MYETKRTIVFSDRNESLTFDEWLSRIDVNYLDSLLRSDLYDHWDAGNPPAFAVHILTRKVSK